MDWQRWKFVLYTLSVIVSFILIFSILYFYVDESAHPTFVDALFSSVNAQTLLGMNSQDIELNATGRLLSGIQGFSTLCILVTLAVIGATPASAS